ncbi:MAG: hypothetical protein LBD85_01060 [Oscillospiraceae bacterium]|jgi:flagellar biosynthesis chaperone FliJ|nr:hypothetical protein [Oscillospiraceae bacterium]
MKRVLSLALAFSAMTTATLIAASADNAFAAESTAVPFAEASVSGSPVIASLIASVLVVAVAAVVVLLVLMGKKLSKGIRDILEQQQSNHNEQSQTIERAITDLNAKAVHRNDLYNQAKDTIDSLAQNVIDIKTAVLPIGESDAQIAADKHIGELSSVLKNAQEQLENLGKTLEDARMAYQTDREAVRKKEKELNEKVDAAELLRDWESVKALNLEERDASFRELGYEVIWLSKKDEQYFETESRGQCMLLKKGDMLSVVPASKPFEVESLGNWYTKQTSQRGLTRVTRPAQAQKVGGKEYRLVREGIVEVCAN